MAFDPAAFREESRDTWGSVARGWEDRRARLMEVTAAVNDWLLDNAALESGQTVLEIGAGTGDLGFAAARRIAPGGQLISADFAPEMVEVARRVGAAAGVSDVDYRVIDAEQMPLEDASIDAILCRWAFMLMADPAAAFAESRRVLRDGGRLTFAAWTTPDRNPWLLPTAMTLVQRGHLQPPDPDGPGIFAFGDPERFLPLLAAAGFAEPEIEEVTFEFTHPDFEDAWDMTRKLTGPIAKVIDRLPDDERQATRDAVEAAATSFRRDDGSYAIPASTWAVVARPA